MQVVDIKGKKWSIGIEWEILAGESTVKKEAKEIADRNLSNHGVIIDYDAITGVGLVKKSPPKAPSASLYLALANQEYRAQVSTTETFLDWIVLEDMGDDKYWMAVIKSGIPAPQFDAIFDITTVKDRIAELLINDTYQVYSKSTEISALFEGIKGINSKSLNDLTSEVKTKIKFTKLRGIPNHVIFGVAGAMAAIGLLTLGVNLLEGRSIAEKRANLEARLKEEENIRKAAYEAEMVVYNKALQENGKIAYEQTFAKLKGNPNAILNAWYNAVSDIGLGTHGWTLTTIECYYNIENPIAVNKFACDYLYKRNGLATNRMLLEDFPHAKINGNEAIITYNVPIAQEDLDYTMVNSLDELRGSKDWNFNMVSQLQLLKIANIDHKIEASSDIMYEIPAKPVSPEEQKQGIFLGAPQQVSLGVATGNVLISGNNFELIKEIADNVDFYGLSLRKAKFEVKSLGVIDWTATFSYYVKSADGPIGGSDSSRLNGTSLGGEVKQNLPNGANLPGQQGQAGQPQQLINQ